MARFLLYVQLWRTVILLCHKFDHLGGLTRLETFLDCLKHLLLIGIGQIMTSSAATAENRVSNLRFLLLLVVLIYT